MSIAFDTLILWQILFYAKSYYYFVQNHGLGKGPRIWVSVVKPEGILYQMSRILETIPTYKIHIQTQFIISS